MVSLFPRGRAAIAVALIVALFVACDDGAPTAEPPVDRTPESSPTLAGGRVIALVGTLSGESTWRGEEAFEGADAAVAHLNRNIDDDGTQFELVTLDDSDDQSMATELVRRLAADRRTAGVIYAGAPRGLPPAEDALAEAGIPAFAIQGDLYTMRLLQPHVFQVSPPLLWQARRIVRYATEDRRYRRFGLLAPTSLTGNAAVRAMRSALRGTGRLFVQRYDGPADDLRSQLRALRERRTQALLFSGHPSDVRVLLEALRDLDAVYRTSRRARRAASARPRIRRSAGWHPQLIGFDEMIDPRVGSILPPGTVAAETYARGAHYLPVPSLRSFRDDFRGWWDKDPLGLQRRSYEAARLIGWADRAASGDDDRARILETLSGRRFGGLDTTFGPDDHTTVGETTVGLWAIPRRDLAVREDLPEELPWVPLSRGFTIDGRRTNVLPEDWEHLFRRPPPPEAPAPPTARLRFGISTGRTDPVH